MQVWSACLRDRYQSSLTAKLNARHILYWPHRPPILETYFWIRGNMTLRKSFRPSFRSINTVSRVSPSSTASPMCGRCLMMSGSWPTVPPKGSAGGLAWFCLLYDVHIHAPPGSLASHTFEGRSS